MTLTQPFQHYVDNNKHVIRAETILHVTQVTRVTWSVKKHHYSHALASSVDVVKREVQIRRRLQNNEKEREENSLGQKQETAQSKPLNMSKVWDHYNPKHVVY